MNLRTRRDYYGAESGVDTRRLVPASKLVASLTGIFVQRNKAIVGLNAFAHEAGIHQHGVLAKSECYEIMRPEDVGWPRSELVIGKHSGHHAIGERARELGYDLADDQLRGLHPAVDGHCAHRLPFRFDPVRSCSIALRAAFARCASVVRPTPARLHAGAPRRDATRFGR